MKWAGQQPIYFKVVEQKKQHKVKTWKFSKIGTTGLDISRVCLGFDDMGQQIPKIRLINKWDYALDKE